MASSGSRLVSIMTTRKQGRRGVSCLDSICVNSSSCLYRTGLNQEGTQQNVTVISLEIIYHNNHVKYYSKMTSQLIPGIIDMMPNEWLSLVILPTHP